MSVQTPMNNPRPLNWSEATDVDLQFVQGVCLDIDDTLSTHGKLTAQAFQSLWSLKEAGYSVVPITGRPAGWCDHFARFWPVDAVVGENGAFIFYMDHTKATPVRRRLDTPGGVDGAKQKLEALAKLIQKKFPEARWASDQSYREFDLAIDICEDVPAWPREKIDELLDLCHDQGAKAKLSSIHVNTWFGHFDKRKGFDHLMAQDLGLPGEKHWLFIGDSPNDEPLFEKFEASVGVANLRNYLDRLKTPPRWITARESGAGFSEMAQRLVKLKQK